MGKKFITVDDLDALALGAALLGSGGGGDPAVDKLIAQRVLEAYGPARLITCDELADNDFVIPICGMGAPLICVEKIAVGTEFASILQEFERYTHKKPTVLMTPEIGGSNAFAPLCIASIVGLPVLDADALGRAFPELQMSSLNIHKVSPAPAVLADGKGNTVIINASDARAIESIARSITVTFGSSAHIGLYPMSGAQAKKSVVSGSLSRALKLGRAVLQARKNQKDPIQAIVETSQGRCLGIGSISDIEQKIEEGFLKGTVTIKGSDEVILKLIYQNENLVALHNGTIIATTPDIIIPVDVQTGEAITTESLAYGLRVAVVAMPSDTIWYTNEGLKLVGPKVFGFDVDYKPVQTGDKPMEKQI